VARIVGRNENGEIAMTNAGSQWLRDRVRDFRDRAEAVEDENTRARLLSAAMVYEDQAVSIETAEGPHEALVPIFYPASTAPS
jgi:hypothetical protein